MSWHNGDPGTTPEQEEALEKLRRAVSDIEELKNEDNYFFLRWLRSRCFNVNQAEWLIRKHMEVRKRLNIETLLTDYTPPEVLAKYFPGSFFGEDREGHPVWYDNFGNLDPRGLYRSVKEEQFLRHKCYQGEVCVQLCEQASERLGRHIDTFVMVIDLENLSFARHLYWPGIRLIRDVTMMLEPNYPERVGKIIVINVPSIFTLAYNLIKSFIDDRTREKISVLRGDYREELQKYISPDQLPAAYGGTRCEPDPYCTKYINHGGTVPEEFYLSKQMETEKEEMERADIRRGSSHQLTYNVDTPGTVLSWEFLSVSFDIRYGLFLMDGTKEVPMVPMKGVDSHVNPVSDSHTCERSGLYVLKFDNSYSWWHSKQVFYSVKLLPPEQSETTPTKAEAIPT